MLGREPEPALIPATEERPLLAPIWHTGLIVIIILGMSVLGLTRRSHASVAAHHLAEYSITLAWEWALLALVLAGTWLPARKLPWRTLLGTPPPGVRSWYHDAIDAVVFWLGSAILLGVLGLLLKSAGAGTPQQVLTALAPQNYAELALFLALSVTAGFCEELIFRGYLLQQATRFAALHKVGGNLRRQAWIGAAASSIIFGAAHLYEGVSGVIAITLFGLMFAWLAVRKQSLRTGMMAHALHDAISGIALYLLTRAHAL